MFIKQSTGGYSRSHKFFVLIAVISLLVIGFSFSIHPQKDFIVFRSIRVGVSLAFLWACYSLYGKRLKTSIYLHIIFYALASTAAIFYEYRLIGIVTMLLNFTSFTFLIYLLYRRIDFNAISGLFLFALIVGIAIHIWLIYYLMIMLYEVHASTSLLIAICTSIAGSFTVSVLALIYNYEYKSKSSIFLVSFIIILVFSETFRGAGYYEIVDPVMAQYWARSLLLLAYLLLFSFAFQEVYKKETDILP